MLAIYRNELTKKDFKMNPLKLIIPTHCLNLFSVGNRFILWRVIYESFFWTMRVLLYQNIIKQNVCIQIHLWIIKKAFGLCVFCCTRILSNKTIVCKCHLWTPSRSMRVLLYQNIIHSNLYTRFMKTIILLDYACSAVPEH